MARKKKEEMTEEAKPLKRKEKLSDDDRKTRAFELAEVGEERDKLELKYKSIQKQFRGELAGLDQRRARLQKEVATGMSEVDAQDSLDL